MANGWPLGSASVYFPWASLIVMTPPAVMAAPAMGCLVSKSTMVPVCFTVWGERGGGAVNVLEGDGEGDGPPPPWPGPPLQAASARHDVDTRTATIDRDA